MLVIPAIDIRGGKVVRLTHGDPNAHTEYRDDPVAVAREFAGDGATMIHVVDLDAALGDGDNKSVIAEICSGSGAEIQTGGGLRSMEAIDAVFSVGAARAVTGTTAASDPELLSQAIEKHGDRMVVALDVAGEDVMVKGWTEQAGNLEGLLGALTDRGARRFLITQIEVDGTLDGPDATLYDRVMGLTDRPIIASGGIRNETDLRLLDAVGVEAAIVGKAIYEGAIRLSEVTDL